MDQAKLMAMLASKKQSMKKVAKTVKPKAGKNRVRLLPGWRKGEEHVWFHDFGQHFIKDAADQLQAVYLCTHATYDKPCEVCAALAVAGKSADDETMEVLAQARANKSILVNALMLDSDEPNTPVILELRSGVFGKILEILEEWEGKPLDPDAGQEIIITREGAGKLTKYDANIGPKVYKVPAASLSKLNDLDDYVRQESDEQKRKAIAAVNSVAGYLPASAGGDVPRTRPAALAAPVADDELGDIPDLEELENGAVAKPAPRAAAKPAPVNAGVALDSEIDDLMGDLE